MTQIAAQSDKLRHMTEAVKRIDYGVKRGKRIKPSDLERTARDEAGKFITAYSPELKEKALTNALEALECGARVEQIADSHGIPRSTLYSWLVGDERASKLRTQFFDGQVMRNMTEIRASASPLDLARAREELAGWIKVAERRDSKSYGQKQEVQVNVDHNHEISQALETRISDLILKIRDASQQPNKIIDIEPDSA